MEIHCNSEGFQKELHCKFKGFFLLISYGYQEEFRRKSVENSLEFLRIFFLHKSEGKPAYFHRIHAGKKFTSDFLRFSKGFPKDLKKFFARVPLAKIFLVSTGFP